MKTTIQGVVVLCEAIFTHGEFGHRCLRTIVGQVTRDGKARATVCAIRKRIAITAIGGVKHIF